jgi:hypothetical protein
MVGVLPLPIMLQAVSPGLRTAPEKKRMWTTLPSGQFLLNGLPTWNLAYPVGLKIGQPFYVGWALARRLITKR